MEPRRGRPVQRFAIHRVRLLGFHNFVDETIELRDGGHLFLLGDNGSGKTTVLDAIHLVLTGTLGIELNAAARVGARSEAGRTLQGLALRYDAERGVLNEHGGIAYAALELVDPDQQASLVIAIGIEATTMDSDVTRWGVLLRGRLEDLPLVDEGASGRRPLGRDALRARIDKQDFYAKMSELRRAIGDRLFGGAALYEEVCRFWSMAKAYREIVSRARDFEGLFVRLLPAPNRETFLEILSSARALGELEDTLAQVEDQERYVAGLVELVESIRSMREAIARYEWLRAFRRREEASAARGAADARRRERRDDERRARARLESLTASAKLATEALLAAQAKDADGLASRLRGAEAQLARDEAEASRRAHDHEVAKDRARAAADERERATNELSSRWSDAVERLAALQREAMPATAALVERERVRASACTDGELGPLDERAGLEIESLVARVDKDLRERERARDGCAMRLERLRSELARLEAQREELPGVPGFVAARDALRAGGVDARPLYELLEPKPSAKPADLVALEQLLGDVSLAAFVVAPREVGRARSLVLPCEGASVVVRVADDARVPPWVSELFASRTPDFALRAIATLLVQPASLGELSAPDALGDVEHRGVAARASRPAPRLVGEAARRRAHEERAAALRASIAASEEERASLDRAVTAAVRHREEAERVRTALAALRGAPIVEAFADVRAARGAVVIAERAALEARERASEASARAAEAAQLVEALRARAREVGLDDLERALAELRAAERRAHDEERAALLAHAEIEKQIRDLDVEVGELDRGIEALDAELVERTRVLRERLVVEVPPGEDALAHYVRAVQRGDQFKSVEHIEGRLREVEREEYAACNEIAGDGSRGVRNIGWAPKFGFSWSAERARVEGRRGEPLGSVRAEIARTVAEQREVVNEKTRALMDRLVMGALARELQEQVERLHRTVSSMNKLLAELRFGLTRYQFKVVARDDRRELVDVVRKVSLLDEESRARFRQFVDERIDEIKRLDDPSEVPELLDYRRWFDYRLTMRTTGADDKELTRDLRALGSGGEQGVPNYLLVLALARLMFDNADARARPLLFDEAFYGIDAGRRDQLLRFATDLGLQIVVASPDQDGVTKSASRTTTLFLVKDSECDVHLAPYHYWNDGRVAQPSLLEPRADESAPSEAVCVVAGTETE